MQAGADGIMKAGSAAVKLSILTYQM